MTDVVTVRAMDAGEVLRLAASLDQVSPHVLAGAIVRAARRDGCELSFTLPTYVDRGPGIRGPWTGARSPWARHCG